MRQMVRFRHTQWSKLSHVLGLAALHLKTWALPPCWPTRENQMTTGQHPTHHHYPNLSGHCARHSHSLSLLHVGEEGALCSWPFRGSSDFRILLLRQPECQIQRQPVCARWGLPHAWHLPCIKQRDAHVLCPSRGRVGTSR